jgi:hypothetical protein
MENGNVLQLRLFYFQFHIEVRKSVGPTNTTPFNSNPTFTTIFFIKSPHTACPNLQRPDARSLQFCHISYAVQQQCCQPILHIIVSCIRLMFRHDSSIPYRLTVRGFWHMKIGRKRDTENCHCVADCSNRHKENCVQRWDIVNFRWFTSNKYKPELVESFTRVRVKWTECISECTVTLVAVHLEL